MEEFNRQPLTGIFYRHPFEKHAPVNHRLNRAALLAYRLLVPLIKGMEKRIAVAFYFLAQFFNVLLCLENLLSETDRISSRSQRINSQCVVFWIAIRLRYNSLN